jgi:hypothetical protein
LGLAAAAAEEAVEFSSAIVSFDTPYRPSR